MKKTIEVDWDDLSDLKKNITLLQIRRKKLMRDFGYEHINFNGNSSNANLLIPTFDEFINRVLIEPGNYYVYAHCNPMQALFVKNNIKDLWLASNFSHLKLRPFYIGKGTGNRCYDLNRNDSHRKIRSNVRKFNKEVEVIKLYENISESCALKIESALIEILGIRTLHKEGYLINIDEGSNRTDIRESYSANMLKVIKANNFPLSENMKYSIRQDKRWLKQVKENTTT